MYCPNCHTYHDANSRFCSNCGAQLVEPQQTPPQGAYPPPYGAAPQQPAQLSNVLPIVSLIVSICLGNLIGILLGAFSLVNFNRAAAAQQQGDFASVELFNQKSRKLAIAAIIISAICCVLAVLAVIAAVALGVYSGVNTGEPFVQFNYGDPQFPMMIASLFA